MLLTAIFILLLLLVLYLLFVPIDLFIDTSTNQYYVQLKGLAKVNFEADKEELLRVKLKTLFMNFYFYPLKKGRRSKKKSQKNEVVKHKRKSIGINKGIRLLRSFKVRRLLVDVDTGNCVTNAKLFPVFAFFNYHLGTFRVNFEGRNRMALHIQNRPFNIIKSFINF